jgi:hypothetical protein
VRNINKVRIASALQKYEMTFSKSNSGFRQAIVERQREKKVNTQGARNLKMLMMKGQVNRSRPWIPVGPTYKRPCQQGPYEK